MEGFRVQSTGDETGPGKEVSVTKERLGRKMQSSESHGDTPFLKSVPVKDSTEGKGQTGARDRAGLSFQPSK